MFKWKGVYGYKVLKVGILDDKGKAKVKWMKLKFNGKFSKNDAKGFIEYEKMNFLVYWLCVRIEYYGNKLDFKILL